MAIVTMNQIRFRDGRIVSAEGRLRCLGGVVGKSLLESAAQAWNVSCTPDESDSPYLAYDQLSLDFSLQASGLTLGAPASVVMSNQAGPLVTLRNGPPRSATSLVQLLGAACHAAGAGDP